MSARRRWRLLDAASANVELLDRLDKAAARARLRAAAAGRRDDAPAPTFARALEADRRRADRRRIEEAYARHLERQARRVHNRVRPFAVLTFEGPGPRLTAASFVGPRGVI